MISFHPIFKKFEVIRSAYAVHQTVKFWKFSKSYVVAENVDEIKVFRVVRVAKGGAQVT